MPSYSINWTDDTLKAPFTLDNGVLDSSTTTLMLTGRNVVNWGEPVQENFLHLLERFASLGTPPASSTTGQLWFDASVNKLKIYYGAAYNPLRFSKIDSATAPASPHRAGRLWYNTTTNLLMVWTGTAWVSVCSQCGGGSPAPTPTPSPGPTAIIFSPSPVNVTGSVGTTLSQIVAAYTPIGTPASFTATVGATPPGLSIVPSGTSGLLVSGNPSSDGLTTVTYLLTTTNGNTGSVVVNYSISAASATPYDFNGEDIGDIYITQDVSDSFYLDLLTTDVTGQAVFNPSTDSLPGTDPSANQVQLHLTFNGPIGSNAIIDSSRYGRPVAPGTVTLQAGTVVPSGEQVGSFNGGFGLSFPAITASDSSSWAVELYGTAATAFTTLRYGIQAGSLSFVEARTGGGMLFSRENRTTSDSEVDITLPAPIVANTPYKLQVLNTAGQLRFYMNGLLAHSTVALDLNIKYIGYTATDFAGGYLGLLDEVRVTVLAARTASATFEAWPPARGTILPLSEPNLAVTAPVRLGLIPRIADPAYNPTEYGRLWGDVRTLSSTVAATPDWRSTVSISRGSPNPMDLGRYWSLIIYSGTPPVLAAIGVVTSFSATSKRITFSPTGFVGDWWVLTNNGTDNITLSSGWSVATANKTYVDITKPGVLGGPTGAVSITLMDGLGRKVRVTTNY